MHQKMTPVRHPLGVSGAAIILLAAALCVQAAADLGALQSARDASSQEDRPRHDLQVGLAALRQGEAARAASSLDEALGVIETEIVDDDGAMRARGFWREPNGGTFVGDPYERTMAYLYRGVLHLQAGEWAHASEAFDEGAGHDQFHEDWALQGDFHLTTLLASWSAFRAGDMLWQERVENFNQDTKSALSFDAESCLALVESGTAPRKLRDGVGGFKKVYRRGKKIRSDRVILDHPSGFIAYPHYIEDIYWQARSRGIHEVKAVNQGMVQFVDPQAVAEELGVAMRGRGPAMRGAAAGVLSGTNVEFVGAPAAAAVSGVQAGVAIWEFMRSKPKPEADARAWTNLPDRVSAFIVPCAAAADGQLQAKFIESTGGDLGIGLPIHFDPTTRTTLVGREVDL